MLTLDLTGLKHAPVQQVEHLSEGYRSDLCTHPKNTADALIKAVCWEDNRRASGPPNSYYFCSINVTAKKTLHMKAVRMQVDISYFVCNYPQ